VTISNDDSLEAFRSRYAGTTMTTLPLVIRRGAETITLQLPIRLTARVQTGVLPIPGASGKASTMRHGILTGSPPPVTPAR
jgi:hypothetical protein